MSPANYEAHTLSTAINLIDKGVYKLKNILEWPWNCYFLFY